MSGSPSPAFPPAFRTQPAPSAAASESVALRDLIQGAVAAVCTLLIVFTVLAWALF